MYWYFKSKKNQLNYKHSKEVLEDKLEYTYYEILPFTEEIILH